MPADVTRIIELVFRGIDETGAAAQAAISNTERFAGSLQSATQPIADFTLGALRVEAAVAAVGVALVGVAVNQASNFQGALLDLQKVLEESDGPIDQYAAAARQLGLEFGVASTDVLGSIANFRQAGFTAQEALQITRDALNLKIAGDIEAAQGSELLIASLRGFQLEASEATRIVDLLNEVSNQYATNLPELATGFAQLSPVARAAGLSLEETAGILTPGIEVFRSGSEVANALRTALLRLVDDRGPVVEALESIGVTQRDANGELRSARDIYFDVAQALQGLDDNQKIYIASQLAGIDQSARFLAVTEGLASTLRIAGNEFNYAGSAAREVEIRLAATETAVARTGVAIQNAFISAGTPLLDETSRIADGITSIFGTIAESVSSGPLSSLVSFVEGIFGEIEATVAAVARNLPAALEGADLSGFENGIRIVLDSLQALFREIDLSSPDGLRRAIETLGTAFQNFQSFIAGVITSFRPLVETLFSAGEGANQLGTEFFAALGNISGIITQVNLLAGAMEGLSGYITAVIAVMGANSASGLIQSFYSAGAALAGQSGLLALLGQAGLVGAAGAGGFAIGSVLAPAIDNLVSRVAGTETTLGGFIYDLINGREETERLGLAAQTAAPALVEVGDATRTSAEAARELPGPYAAAGAAMLALAQNAQEAAINYDELVRQQIAQSERAESLARANDEFSQAIRGAAFEAAEYVRVFDDSLGIEVYEIRTRDAASATSDLARESAGSAESLRRVEEETQRAAEAARNYQLEMERLRSQETVEAIRGGTAIATAQIEADTARVQAAFESINTTVQSTGETIVGLTDILASNYNSLDFSGIRKIEEQIDAENERRDEALRLQRELTEVQIEELRARTESLARGDALITVDGAGLQPHLEAFMFEILRAIQVRVNQDGLEMLVGA